MSAEPTTRAPVTPRPAATLMLLRDHGGLEVLMMRRSSAAPFVPGAHVFPGGAVDDVDGYDHTHLLAGRSVDEVDRVLGTRGASAYWIAAVRECLEEVGILLATDIAGRHVDHRHPALHALDETRRAIETGERTMIDHLAAHDLRVPMSEIAYVSRWITPESSPRRYDARFFAARMPEGQDHSADGWEAVESAWWKPDAALTGWQAGDIDLIEPTIESLRLLREFATADEAITELLAAEADVLDDAHEG